MAETKIPAGLMDIFNSLVDRTSPKSTKRALALLGGVTLCLCAYALTLAVLYQAADRGVVDPQLVWCAMGSYSAVGLLAGVSYHKPEQPAPGAGPLTKADEPA